MIQYLEFTNHVDNVKIIKKKKNPLLDNDTLSFESKSVVRVVPLKGQ